MSTPYFQVNDQVWLYMDGQLALGRIEDTWTDLEKDPPQHIHQIRVPLTPKGETKDTQLMTRTETHLQQDEQLRKVGEFTGRGPIRIVKYGWMKYRKPEW